MAGIALKNWRLFESLCGEDFYKIVLTTTMWDHVDERTGYDRENVLKDLYWKAMVERGSSVRRFLLTRTSAFEVLEPILEGVRHEKPLLIQREIEDFGLRLYQTSAGRTFSKQLEELVLVNEEKLNRIRGDLKGPQIAPRELNLLMEEYQQVSVQIMNDLERLNHMKRMNDVKRMNPLSKEELRRIFG